MSAARDALAETTVEGKFDRVPSTFRDIISSQHDRYLPEFQRYHLYISLACPWANRCLVMLKLKGLQDCIGLSVTHPTWQRSRPNDPDDLHCGWAFCDESTALKSPTGHGNFTLDRCTLDTVNGCSNIRDVYDLSAKNSGTPKSAKFSVPVLWDKLTGTIVNNESSEIVRMLSTVFDQWATGPNAKTDYYPLNLRQKIDEINDLTYSQINDGVYKCGFARTQSAYDKVVIELYLALDKVEVILGKSRYLVGDDITEADIRLFMTLVRFDEVYVVYFKCNIRRIADYPNILNYCRDLYQSPNFAECISMDHIKTHYFSSHAILNPYAIIPRGPDFVSTLLQPHNRLNITKNHQMLENEGSGI